MPKSNNWISMFSVILNIAMIGVIISLSCYFVHEHFLMGYCTEVSNIDGKEHSIQCDYSDKQKAADLLADLNISANHIIQHLNEKYKNNNSDYSKLTKNLLDRYRGGSRLVETNPVNSSNDTSYTLDKGYLVSMCLRASKSKSKAKFHDLNTLRFVLLHELTHIAANVQQHPDRFWEVFKWILKEAVDAGIYQPVDYSKDPVHGYCDIMNIDYNPYYDSSVADI